MTPNDRYKIAFRTSIITGVFAVIVALLLINDYARRAEEDPLSGAIYTEMRDELRNDPNNEALQASFRELDAELREVYFDQRSFTYWGAWLLLLSSSATIGLGKWAAVLRRRLPDPRSTPQEHREAADEVDSRTGRYAVAGLAALTVVVAFGFFAAMENRFASINLVSPHLVSAERQAESVAQPATAAAEAAAELDEAKTENQPSLPSEAERRENWPRFRGPHGLGIVSDQSVRIEFDAESGDGVVWQSDVPLPGNNSPIIWGNRIFLSGATEEKREVICFATETGERLWSQEVPSTPESTAEVPEVMDDTGYAAPTMATDGRSVFAIFANGDIGAFDFEGKLTWSRSLGIPINNYGHASSLTTFENLLIVQFDQGHEGDALSKLLALDVQSGETVWEANREEVPNSWATPIIVDVAGEPQLIVCGPPSVVAYSPRDGSEIWRAECLDGDVGPSPVSVDGIVVVANEMPGVTAIKADGEGDVTETHLLWENYYGAPALCSPLATEKMVFLLTSDGLLCAYDLQGAEDPIWEHEIDASFSSSPTMIDNHLHLIDTDGKVYVLDTTMEGCTTIAESNLGDECVTSPAVKDGRMYFRTKSKLICIGK
ncbi:outer membrane biogenesis protein BamB [Novipirellula aureliae]|uniref:Outer membrane biogenesis protein BamB n=1 Tax=Novipirellula aureliae TaxID=2527966 RepID=A0A5C6DMK6_9BACT|nr:PQQ-binding-like beta-propeller repeat protein [Novipirellula aureliae]TWU37882.1 outer membrane biogenesis protein BamB [Novipirellula aureliae]